MFPLFERREQFCKGIIQLDTTANAALTDLLSALPRVLLTGGNNANFNPKSGVLSKSSEEDCELPFGAAQQPPANQDSENFSEYPPTVEAIERMEYFTLKKKQKTQNQLCCLQEERGIN